MQWFSFMILLMIDNREEDSKRGMVIIGRIQMDLITDGSILDNVGEWCNGEEEGTATCESIGGF